MNIHRKDKAKLKKVPKIKQSYPSRATVRDTIQSLEVNWRWNPSGKTVKDAILWRLNFKDRKSGSATGAITQSSGPELDLELSLGQKFPEPSATLATRKFF
ncbi:unnamed protein product [Ilex paraguariensis]|uniref:Uncharacterized protein n=1 Tax=Ilex paraguariensis TaxID=185542 RepID=A0ABC8RGK2_9AQUA